MTLNALKVALFSALALFTALCARAQGLPALTITNLGSFAVRSQTSITNNDPGVNSSYSIIGGGNELWGPFDKGIIGYFPTNGDFDIKVRVDSLQPVHRYAKTGLMVRESLSTTSRMVSLFAAPTGPTDLPPDQPIGEDTVEFNFRRAAGDGSNNIGLGSPGYPNAWLRLARRGNIIYGLIGHDGINWIISGSVDTSTWPAGAFKSATLLGIGSSSHDDTRLVASELRQFSPVTTVGAVQILQQPANGFGLADSRVAFSVGLNDPVDAQYQWFANGISIPGATNAIFNTPTLSSTNDGTRYKVTVTGRNGNITSNEATLSVVAIDAPENPDVLIDFDDGEIPSGTRVFGGATIPFVDPAGGFGGSGGLVLTPQANNQSGSFIIDDFNFGEVVDSFTVAFKMQIGPGSARPADGVSFSFGTSIPNAIFPAPQQGVGPGLAISFDIYDNGVTNVEAPAIDVFYGVDPSDTSNYLIGNVLHKPLPISRLVTSRYVNVVVHMSSDGKLDLSYDGEVIAYHIQTGFTPVAGGKFAFGAFEGGNQDALQAIDDIYIDTTTQTTDAYLSSIAPLGNNASATPEIKISLVDLATTVNTNSIQLRLNGVPIIPSITQSADPATTTVSYSVTNLLAAFSTNITEIIWSDSAAVSHTNTAVFKVGNYVTLSASFAAPLGSGDSNNLGFSARFYQIASHLTENSAFAEAVLAGLKGTNIADLTLTDDQGFFVDPALTTTIDYDVNAAPDGISTFPGIPGITFSKENFAAEILASLEFPHAGFYQMGVRSDDGFILSTGPATDPVTVGSFEGAREPFDTVFGFVVPQAGIYPFRLLYYQGGGGAALRWFSLSDTGEQILVNDPNQPEALRAFRTINAVAQIHLAFTQKSNQLTINWDGGGALESAPGVSGPWSTVPAAVSGYTASTLTGEARFYRVKQ